MPATTRHLPAATGSHKRHANASRSTTTTAETATTTKQRTSASGIAVAIGIAVASGITVANSVARSHPSSSSTTAWPTSRLGTSSTTSV